MEIFKDVVGYEGIYMVSNLGRVKSLERPVATWAGTRVIRTKLLKQGINDAGYRIVGLYKNRKQYTYTVHWLVAAAFIGPRPDGYHCCHNDGNRTNNVVSNLRYDTPKGNSADKILHDTHQRGERHGLSKLTEVQVLAIRSDKRPRRAVAADYGITRTSVSDIRLRKTWQWL